MCSVWMGDWVDCGADARFDLTDEITISAWIKVGKFDKPWQAIIAKGDKAWRLQRDQATDALAFSCSGVLPVLMPTEDLDWGELPGHTAVNDGRWHHIAGVFGGGRMSLYVDGARWRSSHPPVPSHACTPAQTAFASG